MDEMYILNSDEIQEVRPETDGEMTGNIPVENNAEPKNESMGSRIARLRKECGFTQEALAGKVGVTYQAVSKWENNGAFPDVTLLPELADIFGVSVDELFGRTHAEKPAEQEEKAEIPKPNYEESFFQEDESQNQRAKFSETIKEIPWADDEKYRAVIFCGRKLLKTEEIGEWMKEITLHVDSPVRDLISSFSVQCEEVRGSISAGGYVECDMVSGNVAAGGYVECDMVSGNVAAGGYVECDMVSGDAAAGGYIECDTVEGDVSAGNYVECSDVGGDVSAGSYVECSDVSGDVTAGEYVECSDVGGNVSAKRGNVECGDVSGHVDAGGDVECGDVGGNIRAGGDVNC